jgi:hypothetical protein
MDKDPLVTIAEIERKLRLLRYNQRGNYELEWDNIQVSLNQLKEHFNRIPLEVKWQILKVPSKT